MMHWNAKYSTNVCIYVDEPGAPERPEVEDWTQEKADLTWTPPASDGGAPIEKYIIEKKEKFSSMWSKAGETEKTSFTVKGLKDGAEYEFRVIAVNKAGPGQPSEPSQSIVAKDRFGKTNCFPKCTVHSKMIISCIGYVS